MTSGQRGDAAGSGARPVLRTSELLDALELAADILGDHAAALDRLAVGDDWGLLSQDDPGAPAPGSDLAATLTAACAAARADDARDFSALTRALARGSREGARGQAGRRLARLLAGAGGALRNADHLDGLRAALALEAGAEELTGADDGRHPGRLPAVAAASADGALAAADEGADLGDVLVAAADAGLAELEHGPLVDPTLAGRGAVDPAAAGFLLLLDALASVVTGEPLPAPPSEPITIPAAGHRYEVRCHVRPHDGCGPEEAAHLEAVWHELGDVVEFEIRGDDWLAAVHTARPGAAVEALVEVGRPADLHIAVLEPARRP